MGSRVKFLTVVCATSLAACLGMITMPLAAIPASAAGSRATHFGPNAVLEKKAGTLIFVPDTLTVPILSAGRCKATNYQFSITNATKTARLITDNGTPFIDVPPGRKQVFCAWDVGTQVFGLPKAATTLTVNVTPAEHASGTRR
jgi:hypothetical protein